MQSSHSITAQYTLTYPASTEKPKRISYFLQVFTQFRGIPHTRADLSYRSSKAQPIFARGPKLVVYIDSLVFLGTGRVRGTCGCAVKMHKTLKSIRGGYVYAHPGVPRYLSSITGVISVYI